MKTTQAPQSPISRFYFLRVLVGLAAVFFAKTEAATYPLTSANSGQTISVVNGDVFTDSGNTGGDYSNNENRTITFQSAAGTTLVMDFTSFAVESGYDFLRIYDGPTTASPQIGLAGGYSGGTVPGTTPGTVTASGNSLTFRFTSDNIVAEAGWVANIQVNNYTKIFFANFETSTGNNAWTTNAYGTDTATAGKWARGAQPAYKVSGEEWDVQSSPYGGGNSLATGLGPDNTGTTGDVDGGVTSTRSPLIALPAGQSIRLTFDYYVGSNSPLVNSFVRFHVLNSSGAVLETLYSLDSSPHGRDAVWATFRGNLSAYAGQSVYLLLEARDADGIVLEAAVDNVYVNSHAKTAIRGTVWEDQNADGIKDPGEPGIAGVMVELLDSQLRPLDNPNTQDIDAAFEITDTNGDYAFDDIYQGDVVVQIATPPGAFGTSSSPTVEVDNQTDNDDNGIQTVAGGRIVSPLINIADGEIEDTIDFGLVASPTLPEFTYSNLPVFAWRNATNTTGAIWNVDDTTRTWTTNYTDFYGNSSSLDVTMTIVDPDNRNGDNDLHSAATHPFDPAGGGAPVPGGTYPDNVPGDGSITDPWDSDLNPLFTQTNGGYGANYLTIGMKSKDSSERVTYRFTFSKPVKISNLEIADIDSAGLLYESSGGATGNQSRYASPGNAFQDRVEIYAWRDGVPVGVTFTNGSSLVANHGTSFGIFETAFNKDLPADDAAGKTTVSTAMGVDSFEIVYSNGSDEGAAERYQPRLYDWWANLDGKLGNLTYGASDDHGIRISGFGLVASDTSNISGTVYEDTDGNGAGDVVLAGVTLSLVDSSGNPVTDAAGNPIAPVVTGNDGTYLFTNLVPGDYQVVQTQPSGYQTVTDGDTTDGGDDAANTSTTDNLIPVSVIAGETDTGNDFVEEVPQLGSISGTVLVDTNNDNIGATPLPGVTLTLTDASGNPIDGNPNTPGVQPVTATTDSNGNYVFNNVSPGDYGVSETQPSGYLTVTDGDTTSPGDDAANTSTLDNFIPVSVTAGESDTGNDFVEEQPATICGKVTIDTNNDNLGDTNLGGVTLTLKDSSGNDVDSDPNTPGVQPTTVISASDGTYCFTNVPPGSYLIVETQPSGYLDVTDGDTTADTAGSPTDPANSSTTDNIIPVNVGPGETDDGNNFVEEQPGSISGTVLVDTNNDNIGDTPLPGVILTLTDASGNPIDGDPNTPGVQPVTATTDSNGNYVFNNVSPGDYGVSETQPSGYLTVTDGDTTSPGDDAANTSTLDNFIPVSVVGGETDTGNNFVEEQPATICGKVTIDTNNDNLGDTNLGGVTLTLKNSSGNDIDSDPNTPGVQPTIVISAPDGTYCFANVPPGSYLIVETQPSGYLDVTDGDTTADTAGSPTDPANSSSTDNIIPVNVGPGETDDGNNFVEEQPAGIGNLVFWDRNNDGLYNPAGLDGILGTADDESGIAGITVELLDGSGNPIDSDPNTPGVQPTTTVTASDGTYSFNDLPAGDYQVKITTPPVGLPRSSTPTDTADNQQDNDDNGIQASIGGSTISPVITISAGESDYTIDFGFLGYTKYTNWGETCLPAGQDGNGDNPDGDMFTNALEYGFALDPCLGEGCATMFMPNGTGGYDITFTRPLDAELGDLAYCICYTTSIAADFSTWGEVPLSTLGGSYTVTPNPDGTTETVTLSNVQSLLPAGSVSGFFTIAVKIDCDGDGTPDVIDYAETQGFKCTIIEQNECETIADPFIHCPVFSGVIDGVSGLTIDLSTTSGTGIDFTAGAGVLESGKSYHIEITSGALEGHRFELSGGSLETLTAENDNNLCAGAPYSSYDTSSGLPAALVGSTFVIVQDKTIAELVDPYTLNGTTSSSTADRILMPDGAGGWKQYWVVRNNTTGAQWWALSGDGIVNHNNDTVSEMQGMFLHPKGEQETVCQYGMVRDWDFATPLCDGATLLANGYPMDLTPTQAGYDAVFATGTRSPTTSDQILTWNRDGVSATDSDGYCGYWYLEHDTLTKWVKIGVTSLTDYSDTAVLKCDRSYFYDSYGDHLDHVVTQPWTAPIRFDNGTCP